MGAEVLGNEMLVLFAADCCKVRGSFVSLSGYLFSFPLFLSLRFPVCPCPELLQRLRDLKVNVHCRSLSAGTDTLFVRSRAGVGQERCCLATQ